MAKKETIIVFSAHSDDFVIGAGGTIANYTQEGKKVIAVIFSYGESSHPWLQKKIIQKMRAKETVEACKLLRCAVLFFDLKEFNFRKEYETKGVQEKLLQLLQKEKPSKIFTHSSEDPHPDHSVVNSITAELVDKSKLKPEVYIYSVWNPVSFKTEFPSLRMDISKTFHLKLKALRVFRSQKWHILYPFFLLMIRAIRDGFRIRKKFGEQFYRIQ